MRNQDAKGKLSNKPNKNYSGLDAETVYVLSPIYKDVIQQALEMKGTMLFISISCTRESNSHAEKAKYLINKSKNILIITCIKNCLMRCSLLSELKNRVVYIKKIFLALPVSKGGQGKYVKKTLASLGFRLRQYC